MGAKVSTSSLFTFFIAIWIGLAIFVTSLQFFIHHLPKPAAISATDNNLSADGIIVATGGQARLAAGLTLLSQGQAPILLLTGVGEGVTKDMLADSLSLSKAKRDLLACCIELEFIAADTKGNALAAQKWVTDNQLSSVIVVTAHYHMPRILLELNETLTTTEIISFPVIPPDLSNKNWLGDWPSLKLYAREFVKYQIRKLTILFDG